MTQRNDICEFIKNTYNVLPEVLWAKYPDYFVFRNTQNKKWFAIIMNVSKDKLGFDSKECVDIINVKCDPIAVNMFIQQKGILPAYHMNKQNWISVLLDGSCDKNSVFFMIEQSYQILQKQKDKKWTKKVYARILDTH